MKSRGQIAYETWHEEFRPVVVPWPELAANHRRRWERYASNYEATKEQNQRTAQRTAPQRPIGDMPRRAAICG